MARVAILSAFLFIASASETVSPLTSSQQQYALAIHNKARREVKPQPVTPLPAVTYDAALEKEVMESLKNQAGCKDLASDRKEGTSYFAFSLKSATAGDFIFRMAMNSWIGQKSLFKYLAGCLWGDRCREYRQMVWVTSSKVGCAIKQCGGSWNYYKVQCKYPKLTKDIRVGPVAVYPYYAAANEGDECWSYILAKCRDGPCAYCGPAGLCCQKGRDINGCKNQGGLNNHRCVAKATSPPKTCGGNANGATCKFPFDYKGVRYQSCTQVDDSRPFCYTDGGKWGNCNCASAAETGFQDEGTVGSSLLRLANVLEELSELN